MSTVSQLGSRGLVIFTKGGEYLYKSEKEWRKDTYLREPLKGASGVVAKIKESVFVDLDQWTGLAEPQTPSATKKNSFVEGESIVLKENGLYYQIPLADLPALPAGAEGDAGVVVKRGAVAAAIPANIIPSGTYCVLVNLASLR